MRSKGAFPQGPTGSGRPDDIRGFSTADAGQSPAASGGSNRETLTGPWQNGAAGVRRRTVSPHPRTRSCAPRWVRARSRPLPQRARTAGPAREVPGKAVTLEWRESAHVVVEHSAGRPDRHRRNRASDRPWTAAAAVRLPRLCSCHRPRASPGSGQSRSGHWGTMSGRSRGAWTPSRGSPTAHKGMAAPEEARLKAILPKFAKECMIRS